MPNHPRPPPPLQSAPSSQWQPPDKDPPWNFPPPPMYPSTFPPNVPPPFANIPFPPNVNQPPLVLPSSNVPIANVPPLPNVPPPPLPGTPFMMGRPPRLPVVPGCPPTNPQGIPTSLRFPAPETLPMPKDEPPTDPKKRDKYFPTDQAEAKRMLSNSNKENGVNKSTNDSDAYSEIECFLSQEETDELSDFSIAPADELRSQIYQRASEVLVRKKVDDNLLDEPVIKNSTHSNSDKKHLSPDEETDSNKNTGYQTLSSEAKKKYDKSSSLVNGSPKKGNSSSKPRASPHSNDRSCKSPSQRKAFSSQNGNSYARNRSSRIIRSPSLGHRKVRSRSRDRLRQSSRRSISNERGISKSKDKLSKNKYSHSHHHKHVTDKEISRYDKHILERYDSKIGELYSRVYEDRHTSRSKVPDSYRDKRRIGTDKSNDLKDYKSRESSKCNNLKDHKSREYSKSNNLKDKSRASKDGKSSNSYREENNKDYNKSGSKSKSNDKGSKANGSSVKVSVKDKTLASSDSEEDNNFNILEKVSPKKVKSVNPKLKLYDDIWRKVRSKNLTTGTQKKLTIGKLPPRPKENEEMECETNEKTAKVSEETVSQVCSGEEETAEKPVDSSEAKKIDKSSKPNGDARVEKRDRKRSSETRILPSLTCEPSKCITSTSAEDYYKKIKDSKEVVATDDLKELHKQFAHQLVERGNRARARRPKYEPAQRRLKLREHKPNDSHCDGKSSSSSSCSDSSSEEEDTAMEELERKRSHPDRLHPELWFNEPNEMNDGPLCRCSAKARRTGIRHGIYVGEEHLPPCDPYSNNADRLYHYKICIKPVTNFLTKNPTFITHGKHMYIFEGFSMFSHKPLPNLPNCKVIRFNYEYTLMYVAEPMPENFTVAGLELFSKFLFQEILELVDLDWRAHKDLDGCPQFHFMPRFARKCGEKGKELLSLNVVMEYLLRANKSLIDTTQLSKLMKCSEKKWQELADKVKGMIVTCPGMKPSSVRVDQLDREHIEPGHDKNFPVIVHFGVRPPQLSYAGNPLYQKAWRNYVKYRHLLANKPKVSYADKHKLVQKELKLQEMRMENDLKRDVTIVISSKGFYQTGLMSDMVQHAMLIPILVCHLRFHASLAKLEEKIGYQFQDRFLLQLALTHPSYRENFGTNPDHARNSLTNCGLRQPQYGDRRIHYMNTRKRGINTLINIMSRFGRDEECPSRINHNERLEFLGDAVVEFLSSTHLFYMFPDLEEGGLATYRAAIVQNQHLALLAKKLELDTFMLYAHGSDLCHDLELRHAMANCFEALMGALFLDAGIEVSDKVFSNTLFPEPELKEVWMNYPLHPLQEQEPGGDRKWIETIPLLQKVNKFEEQIGIEFTHIRLLARALTHRSLGYNNLTLGSNQRLEFLGDTVLQLVASEYLYKFFPQHHEGHLSLLRSSLVNNRTQAVVCVDLGMVDFAIYPYFKVELKPKDKADLLEAFLGALYIDKDLGYCRKFCEICFFPRLQDFIMNQDWNDPKSKLQQCCLTLRSMDGGEPDIPTYKVIECKGPTNTRVYGVAVYFQGTRLAVGEGHSIQQAEMDAASNALAKSKDLFPQLRHQKRAIERSLKKGTKAKDKKRKRSRSRSKDRDKKGKDEDKKKS